jgi:molecular chaperone GrpE
MSEPSTSGSPEEEAAKAVEADLEELAERTPADGVSPSAESEAIRQERDDLRDLAQRVQADFENYRKRMLREQTEKIERANEALIEQLLPVLDSFELALANLGEADEGVRKGVELGFDELVNVLEKAGLERIDTDGKPFDPNVHEAVMQEDGDGDPVVSGTMRAGYQLKGRVLRPAMVKVAR